MASPPLLEASGVEKRYGHVEALRGADFRVEAGEVVALIGDNGAGKSTLAKILSGVEPFDAGEVLFDGAPMRLSSPRQALELGIGVVYQDLALASDLDTPANLFLGRELLRTSLLGRLGFLDKEAMRRGTREVFDRFGVEAGDVDRPVSTLSGGQQQSVAVARAVMFAGRVIFMDEPTAALGVAPTQKVHELIRRVRDEGTAVVLISHNMPEVLAISDRVEVLRRGRRVARFASGDVSVTDLVAAMTGAMESDVEARAH